MGLPDASRWGARPVEGRPAPESLIDQALGFQPGDSISGRPFWPHDLSDEEILERLLALNLERAKGEG